MESGIADTFEANWRCLSLTAALADICRHFAPGQTIPCAMSTPSGPISCMMPRYLYRGECGLYPQTESSWVRLSNAHFLNSAESEALQNVVRQLRWVFRQAGYENSEAESEALLEHYGVPTSVVNFTSSLRVAAAFAACSGISSRGRICVLTRPYHGAARAYDYRKHPWAARTLRQAGFGIEPLDFTDLKSREADLGLGAIWVEFPIAATEREDLGDLYRSLLDVGSDPYAAIVRGEVNHFVELFGKLPHKVPEFLAGRIPMVPRVHLVTGVDSASREVITRHVNPSAFPFSEEVEKENSLRYWSEDHREEKDFLCPFYPFEAPRTPGTLFVWPGTYHGPRSHLSVAGGLPSPQLGTALRRA